MTEEIDYSEDPGYRAHPAISNSDLKYLYSPRVFQLKKQQKLQEPEEEYQRIGSMYDEFLLNRGEFNNKFIERPELDFEPTSPNQKGIVEYIMNLEDPCGASVEEQVAAYSANYSSPSEAKALKMYSDLLPYIRFQINAKDKTVYSKEDWEDLMRTVEECKANSLANYLLFAYKPNLQRFSHLQIVGMEWRGVKWKGELDLVVLDHEKKIIYNVDLKTSREPAARNFAYRYFQKYNYKRQQALYRRLLKYWLQEENILTAEEFQEGWQLKTYCMVLEKVELREVHVVDIPDPVLMAGEEELKEASDLIRFYNNSGWHTHKSEIVHDRVMHLTWDEFLED